MPNNKWLLFVIVLLLLLVLAAAFSKKSVKTEIFIPATAENIWLVLMNEADYKNWNPVLIPLSGTFEAGNTIHYQWNQPSGEQIEMDATIVELIDNELLHQRGGTPGLLTFDHRYELFPEEGGTRVVQSEVYRGIGVWFWNAQQMQAEYAKVNEALQSQLSLIHK